MLVSYPALFYYDSSESVPFFITFPDFKNSSTQGKNVTDAMAMATDWLGINGADYLENGHIIPAPSALAAISLKQNNPYPNDLHYDSEQSFKSMVLVDLDAYLNGKTKVQKISLNFEVGRLER